VILDASDFGTQPVARIKLPQRVPFGFHGNWITGWVTCPAMAVKWLDEPEAHDYDASAAYLSMIAGKDAVDKTVAALKTAKPVYQQAKDILRAAGLALLPEANTHVRADLGKIGESKKLSPILLVRGSAVGGYPLQIADGYHRVCASYLTDENTNIPCHLVSWQ
jgi:hypothetical protein